MNWGGDGNQFGDSRMSSFNSPGAGGGFLDKTFGESPASQDRKQKKKPGIVPITAAGILNATYQLGTDAFVLNEVPLHQVTLVGMISSVTENRTNLSFEINDFTGTVNVKRWLDQDENGEEYEEARFREDTYVRVFGYIKRFDENKKHVVAFHMVPVTDFNEITMHMFEVIYASLSIQKQKASNADNTTHFGNNSFSAQGDLGPETGNMSKSQRRIYEMVNQVTLQQGIFIGDLVTRLNMSEQSVRDDLEHLSNEGLIYSTTDDDHFRSTNAAAE